MVLLSGNKKYLIMEYFKFFALGLLLTLCFSNNFLHDLSGILSAFLISFFLISYLSYFPSLWASYLIFFSISVTSFFGFTKVLTGSHAESSNFIFYGLSFYTASIAYLNAKSNLRFIDSLKVANPLLIFTGPMALFVKPIININLRRRITYYLPFFVIGIFYFQIIGSPLSAYMFLVNYTDLFSAITFAIIFEIFVYANFSGLSLIVFSTAGILGYKVPLNFRQPFSSTNLIEFWKGWHITLSNVLKELFYKPARKNFGLFGALLLVYMSSAMWHGITFNFMIWGLFHALCFFFTLMILRSNFKPKVILTVPIMFFAVILGRLFFADNNSERLIEKLSFKFEGYEVFSYIMASPTVSTIALILGILSISIEFFMKNYKFVSNRTYKHLRTPLAQFIIIILFIFLATNLGGDYAIYGQR